MDTNDSVERRRLNDLYSLESGEKLLHLRLSYDELTEVAQIALRTELTSRGLWSNDEMGGSLQDHTSLGDENSLDQLESNSLSVWDCKTPEEAEVICHVLRLANITAVSFPLQLRNLRNVQVRVGKDDAEKALTILSNGVPAEVAEELTWQFTSDDFVPPRCRSCNSTDVSLESVANTNHWSCEDCGSRWQDDLADAAAVTSEWAVDASSLSENSDSDAKSNIPESSVQHNRKTNIRSIGFLIFGTLLAIAASWYQPWTALRLLGLCLLIPSEILLVVARLHLGASFSVRAEARSLVTHGLYSRIQNPIYFFGALTLAGLILFLDQPWYLLVFLVVVPVQVIRIGRERKVLLGKFGDSYLKYRKQTWF